jgi:tetratricopeptide (TPR) repeat protein
VKKRARKIDDVNNHRLNILLSLSTGILMLSLYLSGCGSVPGRETKEERPPEFPYQKIKEYIEAGDPDAALNEYRDYLEKHPDSSENRLLLARLLMATGYQQEARLELGKLIGETGPTADVLLAFSYLERLAGNPDKERQYLEEAFEIDRNNPAVLAALGNLHLEAEEYEPAETSFKAALEADLREPTALRGLGIVYLMQEKFEQAADIFGRAIAADPSNGMNYADRARARAALQDRQGAVQDLSTAIELDPGFYWNYIDRGRHYLQLRMWEEADRDLTQAITIDADIFLPYVYRAGLYDRLNRRLEAIADYSRVLELNSAYYFAYAPLAVLHYMEENWIPAAEEFRQAYIHEQAEPSYALLAALSLIQLGEREEAKDYLRAQLESFPGGSWHSVIARYLIDPALELRTIELANKEQNKLNQGRMLFFIASQLLLENRVETALRYLLLVAEIDRRDLAEKRIAESLLSQFGYED